MRSFYLQSIVLVLLLLSIAAHPHPSTLCPASNSYSTLIHDHLRISTSGSVVIQPGNDATCYSYPLDRPFLNKPGVALAVRRMETQQSLDIFFSVRSTKEEKLSSIDFLIRTQWKYTQWVMIEITFIAEDMPNLIANSFSIDTASLAGCSSDSQVNVILPYQTNNFQAVKAMTFINGFEMTSVVNLGINTPFEVQVINVTMIAAGVSVSITVSSATKLFNVFLSLVAYDSTLQYAYSGLYTYDNYFPSYTLTASVNFALENNTLDFYGVNGFIIGNNNSQFLFDAKFSISTGFTFTTASNFQYLTFNYFFISGPLCSACIGNPLFYQGRCYSECPMNTFRVNNECFGCPAGQRWNGTHCVNICQGGQQWSFEENRCVCPQGLFWNGSVCISCSGGRVWNSQTNSCVCPQGLFWNGSICLSCNGGQVWNPQTNCCVCPQGLFWNGSSCISCNGGQIWNPQTNSCNCPQGLFWNGTVCVSCSGGQVWSPQLNCCVCPQGLFWSGSVCVSCNGGQVWNPQTNSCACPQGLFWNGSVCVSCTGGRVWNSQTNSCVCPQGLFWNGSGCISCSGGQVWNPQTNGCVCPQGLFWNGSSCVSCSGGQVWNPQTSSCACPQGLYWTGSNCVSCSGGQVWNPQTNCCVCPLGQFWNNTNCIICSNGQRWDDFSKTCVCPSGQFWNSYQCVTCPTGQVWNPSLNQCTCPSGQNWNGSSCVVACTGGRVWNPSTNTCQCPAGLNWNGAQCINCPQGQYWNGNTCLSCTGGQVWCSTSLACICQQGYQWNGTNCILPCPTGQTPVNGVCQCPEGTYLVNNICVNQPTCPPGTIWKGSNCVPITCPSGTYWNGTTCITYQSTCPTGTVWDGTKCVTNTTQCPSGTFWNGASCQALQCLCPPNMNWVNNQCVGSGTICPANTYFNGQQCQPYTPCTNGRVWSSQYVQCICPTNTFWNGRTCFSCGGGQIFDGNNGCNCPSGSVFNGNQCVLISINQCRTIQNAQWNISQCVCLSGFSFEGLNCVCKGVLNNGFCDLCSSKPNSQWINNTCQCNQGFYENQGQCLPSNPNPNPPSTSICNVATFFDSQQKRCLPCSDGCLSCTSCYSCTQCRPQYNFNPNRNLCFEICGDGKRFSLACDDGNNVDGDGCSRDCKIQRGYSCVGGSPNSADTCSNVLPSALIFTQSGQSHLANRIILNIRLNYLPMQLIKSAVDCRNGCDSVLDVQIIRGDRGVSSIKSSYIPSSTYSFSVELDFGREPIGMFTVQVGIQSSIASKYYSGIDTSSKLTIDVNPALLSRYTGSKDDKL